ncbi:EVI2B protein, partial [Setophaga kirtlandii]|nr:EVI2B protein [Setophaga kirtlandii]
MASSQVLLVVLCGEIWSSLSAAAAPQHAARTESHACSGATSPRADSLLLYQLQATVPSLHQAATAAPAFPGEEGAGDGSWVAALILGSILIGMALAILVILLWKCCLRPPRAQSHWAGRSPFTDGDTSDLCMDSDPGTKSSSVLFMLPWRLKQGTNLQEDPTVSENPPHHTTNTEDGQPPAAGCSGASSAPEQEPAPPAAESCPPPDPPPECSDLPPPPDWLREPAEEPSSDPSEHSALHMGAEEPQPSPPEPLNQEIHETLPQPEHPL